MRYLMRVTVPQRCPGHVEFLRWYEARLLAEGLRASTRYRQVQCLSEFLGWLESRGRTVWQLERSDLDFYAAHLREKGVGVGGRRVIFTMIKKMCRVLWEYLEAEGRTEEAARWRILWESVRLPKLRERRLPQVLSRDEVLRVIEHIGDLEYRCAAALLYEAGLRLVELRNLRVRDVLWDEYGAKLVVRISKSETRTVRVIEFQDLLRRWLDEHPLRGDPDAFLFPSKYDPDRPVGRNVIGLWLKRAAAAAGVRKRVYPHLLRHTRATELYGKLTEREMMYYFGWRKRDMIDVYARLKPEQVDRKLLALYGVVRVEGEGLERRLLVCPSCGHANSPTELFCSSCGRPLRREAALEAVKEEAGLAELIGQLRRTRRMVKSLSERIERLEERERKRRRSQL